METPRNMPEQTAKPEDPHVRFAAERTLLAWLRTGLALMGFGFVVARFGLFLEEIAVTRQAIHTHSYGWSLGLGTALVVLGITVTLAAAWQHWRILERIDRGENYLAPRWSLALIVSALLSIVGTVMIAYLLFVSS